MKRIFSHSVFQFARASATALALFGLSLAPSVAATNGDSAVAPSAPAARESYKLPITRPLDQGDSDLCWVYAALGMLETNYLVRHPQSTIDLSRAAVQRVSIADRFHRQITGDSDHLEDGGLAVDALTLIRQHGLVAEKDFHDVIDSEPVWDNVSKAIAQADGVQDKIVALKTALADDLGVAPRETELDGRELTPKQLANVVLGDNVWTEYDVTPDGPPRIGPSEDPDARPETRVHYVKLATAIDLIHQSLARGEAVVWGSTDNHALLIYGGDYDAEGRPLSYWVKDTFAPYTYQAPAEKIHAELTDVTVATPPPKEARAPLQD